jgi:hypothetical protein
MRLSYMGIASEIGRSFASLASISASVASSTSAIAQAEKRREEKRREEKMRWCVCERERN